MNKRLSLIVSLLFSFVGFCNAQVSWVNGFRANEIGEVNENLPYIDMGTSVKSADGVYDLTVRMDSTFYFEIKKGDEFVDVMPFSPMEMVVTSANGGADRYMLEAINGTAVMTKEDDGKSFLMSLLQPSEADIMKDGHMNINLKADGFNAEFDFSYTRSDLFIYIKWLAEQQMKISGK